jgi:hypothetical protein
MATSTVRAARAQQLQQLLSQLAAAPDSAQLASEGTYSKLRQLRMQQPTSSVELCVLLASALQNGLQLLQQAVDQQ